MHILITRPLEDSEELILKFSDLGHKVSHMPVIRIEKIEHEKINFLDYKAIIFTSANALKL
jgi:Uroporphyrinogen-III synthase